MHDSKLVRYLSAFTPEEVRLLRLFIKSPFYNDGKRPLKAESLLNHLLLFHPEFSSKEVEAETVFGVVFSGEPFKKNKMGNIASEAVQLIRKFIALNCTNSKPELDYWLAQAEFFQQRGLQTDFFHAVENAESVLQASPFQEQEYFQNAFRINREWVKQSFKLNDKKSNANLPEAIRCLDLYYIISKMEYCSYLLTLSRSALLETDSSFLLIDDVLRVAKSHFLDIPIVGAYYYAYSLFLRKEQDGKEDYRLLKTVLVQNQGSISLGTLRTIHTCMRNYLADSYNKGVVESLPELFVLFKEQVKQGTIYQDGHHILASTLQNAITVALKLQENEWALAFLKQHENRINGADDVKSIYQFNLANILFHQANYEEARHCLDRFHFREMFYNLAVRRLEIKLGYETCMSLDVFEYRLKALKSFVHEHKKMLPADKFDSNNNFVKLMLQLFTLMKERENAHQVHRSKIAHWEIRVQHLIALVKKEKTVAEREWLMEKLEGMLK